MPSAPNYGESAAGAAWTGVGQGILRGIQMGDQLATSALSRQLAREAEDARRRQEDRAVADYLASATPAQPFDAAVAGGAGGTHRSRGDSGGALVGSVSPADIAMEAARVKAAGPVRGADVWGAPAVVGDPMVWGPGQPGQRVADPQAAVLAREPAPAVLTPTDPNPLVQRLGFSPENVPSPQELAVDLRRRANAGALPAGVHPASVTGIIDEYANWYARASREAGGRNAEAAAESAMFAQQQADAERWKVLRGLVVMQRLAANPRYRASDEELDDAAFANLNAEKAYSAIEGARSGLQEAQSSAAPGHARVSEDRRQFEAGAEGLADIEFAQRVQAGDVDRIAMRSVGIDPANPSAALAWGVLPKESRDSALVMASMQVRREAEARGRAAVESPTARAAVATTRLPQQTEAPPLRGKEWRPDEVLSADEARSFLLTAGVPESQAVALATGTLSRQALGEAARASFRERHPNPGGIFGVPGQGASVAPAPAGPSVVRNPDGSVTVNGKVYSAEEWAAATGG